ncbi:MAG: hypothetical protein H6645_05390 [Caldilineaceae bacterium]|nr:hypothetical protein [Caldilineaceae bacterium]
MAMAGTQYKILALSPNGEWYRVELPDEEEPAWVYGPLVDAAVQGECGFAPLLKKKFCPAEPVVAPRVGSSQRRLLRAQDFCYGAGAHVGGGITKPSTPHGGRVSL